MTGLALTLVLVAAVVHPTWNLLARRATRGDPLAFVWLTSVGSTAFYVPVVATFCVATHARLVDVPLDLAMMAGTGSLHAIYFALLQRSYRASDFSFVYPLARGCAPAISAVVAIATFGERLDAVQVAGIAIVVAAVFALARARVDDATHVPYRSLAYGVATGLAIASYTLWDKRAVSALAITPILYDFGRTASQVLLLAPAVLVTRERRAAVRATGRTFGREAIGVAILSPFAYVLVLYALTEAPVSLVAPLRESSIVIGAFMGARILREGSVRRRVVAASLMLVGIVALARG